jgi:hypothetical protein
MLKPFGIDIPMMFHILHVERINRYIEDLQDEASEAAVAGNPARAGYLEWIGSLFPEWVSKAEQRAEEQKLNAPRPRLHS